MKWTMDFNRVLIILLLLLFYLPIFSALIDSWLIDPYYSHGFLVPIISAFFIWRKRNLLRYSDRDFNYGVVILALGLFFYGIGIFYRSLFVSAVSFIVVLSGLTLCFCGRDVLHEFMFPICFLIFMIPLPFTDYVSFHMQSFTAACTTSILRLMGIPATNVASQILLENVFFVIGEPCSGLRTMIALLTLSAVFVYVVEGHPNRKIILFLGVFPVAIVANILRVTSILLIANYYGKESAMQFFHDFSSLFLFLLAFAFLILIGKCLGCSNLRNI